MMLVQLDDYPGEEPLTSEVKAAINSIVAEHARYVMRDADLVSFFDEDQFAILMPSTNECEAATPATRLCQRVCQSRSIGASNGPALVTVSIGLAGLEPGDTVATILQRAQESLYQAVRDGGNRVYRHTGSGLEACDPLPDLRESQNVVNTPL
jgi:diguanylate cyclase (GGDEF)-like protein